jgi:hypothetical protein
MGSRELSCLIGSRILIGRSVVCCHRKFSALLSAAKGYHRHPILRQRISAVHRHCLSPHIPVFPVEDEVAGKRTGARRPRSRVCCKMRNKMKFL